MKSSDWFYSNVCSGEIQILSRIKFLDNTEGCVSNQVLNL